MRDFIQFVSEHIYPSVSIYIHIFFLSAETCLMSSNLGGCFLYPELKFSGFMPCNKPIMSFSFFTIFYYDFINILMISRSWNNIATHS